MSSRAKTIEKLTSTASAFAARGFPRVGDRHEGLLLTGLVWFMDAQFGISTSAYCFFYDTWDTRTNELKPGWLPALAGAAYGALCGAITMSIASGYMIVRATIAGAGRQRLSA